MTTCKETKGFLNAYVDGELDSAGSLAVETHIRACASCLSDVENLHALASAIENGSLRFKAPARLTRNVQGAIRAANPLRPGVQFSIGAGPAFWHQPF